MKKTIIIILIAAAAYLIIMFAIKGMKKSTYLNYLHQLGFNVADRMNAQEVQDSYNYLYNYARKFGANAALMAKTTDPAFYARLQKIVSKYGALFNLNTDASYTNIPNIATPVGATPIVPDVKLPTAQNPASNSNNINPPTLNFI